MTESRSQQYCCWFCSYDGYDGLLTSLTRALRSGIVIIAASPGLRPYRRVSWFVWFVVRVRSRTNCVAVDIGKVETTAKGVQKVRGVSFC
jgi:hypothetical protein